MPTMTLTTPIVLNPIQPVALPKNYLFTYQKFSPMLRPEMVCLKYGPHPTNMWSLSDQDKIHASGFSELLFRIMHYTHSNNLWGQSIQIHANYSQPDSGVIFAATQSVVPRELKLPEKPFQLFSPAWIEQLNNKNVPSTTPPIGRRIFWAMVSGSYPNAWMVMPNQRLEDQYPNAPFDKCSYWLSIFGVPIKLSMGVNSPEQLCQLLGGDMAATRIPKLCSAAQILALAGSDGNGLWRHMIWSGSRMLFFGCQNFAWFNEYAGGALQSTSFQDWYTQSGPTSMWNVRKIPPKARTIGPDSLV